MKAAVAGFLAALASAAEPVDVHFMWRPLLPDPADELILEAAVNGGAAAIVTHNVRDFRAAAQDLRPAGHDTGSGSPRADRMSKSTYPLKLPTSVKNAAAELARLDGVSLNQFIAAAVAEKVGTIRTAREFLHERACWARLDPATCSST